MKIGLVLDDTLDTPDGVQQYVLSVGAWLTAQGNEVHYLVGATTRTDVANIHSLSRNLHVKFNGNRMSVPLPASRRKLRDFLVAEQFDVLHIQVPYSPFLAGRLILAAPVSTAIVGTFHILPYTRLVTLANHILALVNRRSGKRFDRMIAATAPARDFARAVYHYDPEVLAHPLRLAEFKDATSDSQTTNIVFLGRLVTRKGAMYLLRAVVYLREHGLYADDVQVYMGGKGDLRPELERYVTANKLGDTVRFMGFIDEAHKAAFLAQADIAVFPSLGGESFGISILEGIAAARGVVLAGNNPGYAAVLQPYPAQLFNPLDTKQFAEKLAWYLNRPAEREAAATAQKTYAQHFDIEVVGRRLLTVYARALQSRTGL